MALQVWLPLNGNLDNQGLSRVTVTNNGATVDNTGKVGKCYSFDGTTSYLQLPSFEETKSICFWLKPSSTGNAVVFVDYRSQLGFGFYSSYIIVSCRNLVVRTYPVDRIATGTWNHIAVVKDSDDVLLYINGELETNRRSNTDYWALSADGCSIGKRTSGSSLFFTGCLNDFRVYDHCLSAKEVKDISKGLVMHYKLNMPNPNLLPVSSQRMTENGQTSTNEYLNICSIFNIVETYGLVPLTISFDIKAAVDHGFSLYGNYGTGNKYMFTSKTIQVSTEWQRITYTFTPWLQNESGTWAGISVYGTYGSGAIVSVRRVKLELGTKATPFEAGFNVAADCSGYKNHGTLYGSVTGSLDTVRHSSSTFFDGTTAAIKIPYNAPVWGNNFTMNIWWKKTELGSKYYETLIGGPSGFEMDTRANNATTLSLYMASARGGNVYSPFEFNKWYMVTLSTDGTNEYYYVNGQLVKTIAKKSMPSGNYYIGAWQTEAKQNFKGYISDVRVFCTCLSAEDILELYETSAFTDDKGTIDAYDFVERRLSIANEDVPDLDSTGVLHTKSFIEHTTLDAMIFKDRVEASRFVEI